jgi:hypothetical protein
MANLKKEEIFLLSEKKIRKAGPAPMAKVT